MKFHFSTALFWAITTIAAVIMLTSCERDIYSPADGTNSSEINSQADFNKSKKKDDGGDPATSFVTTYQLDQADDWDPLYRFSIYVGQSMLLETDPTVTSWGTNYWGYWSNSFPYANNEVNYIIGLTNTTYQFQPLPGGKFDVTKILIVQPYPSGTPTTTVTHPGVYKLVN